MSLEKITHPQMIVLNKVVRDTLKECNSVTLLVRGTSMYPILFPGDRVIVTRVDFQNVRTGDIIVFEGRADVFTHRVIKTTRGALLSKGDNSIFPDPPITDRNLMGKVTAYERNGRQIPLSGKMEVMNVFLGYCHLAVGIVGQISQTVLRFTRGRYRRFFFWMARSLLTVVHLIERILLYGNRIEKSNP